MSNMKAILGDMTLEEFEVKRRTVLGKMTDRDWDQVTGKDDDAAEMYRYWIEIGGKELTQKWVKDHGGIIHENDIEELLTKLVDGFIGWLESFE